MQMDYNVFRIEVGNAEDFQLIYKYPKELVERLEENYLEKIEKEYAQIIKDAREIGKKERRYRTSRLRNILENLSIAAVIILFFYVSWLGGNKLWHMIFH